MKTVVKQLLCLVYLFVFKLDYCLKQIIGGIYYWWWSIISEAGGGLAICCLASSLAAGLSGPSLPGGSHQSVLSFGTPVMMRTLLMMQYLTNGVNCISLPGHEENDLCEIPSVVPASLE